MLQVYPLDHMDHLDQKDQLEHMVLMDHQFLLFPHSLLNHHHLYQSC